jgi:dienelactone hydrolase
VGTLPALLVMALGLAQVSAAALISPVIQLVEVVAANERRFGVDYPWSDASRAVAARLDFGSRAGEIAARDPQPAVLVVTGAEDDQAFPTQAQRLESELLQRYRGSDRVVLTSIPGMKHAFAAEPGIEPAPQTAEAKLVDAAVTDWFNRYLR